MTTPRSILILGGTSWLGGTMARLAHESGFQVTCLARGESGQVPDSVTLVRSDRWEEGAYDGVAERDWDAVFDVNWQPELVRSALCALGDRAGHWTYVSSCSVYSDDSALGADETAATHEPWAGTGRVSLEEYAAAKVSCEAACAAVIPADRLLVARAGLIAGYGDRSDRFGYWPGRVAAASARDAVVLAPAMDSPVQVIDVEDLAGWLISAAETGTAGVMNAVGEAVTFGDVASECATATKRDPSWAVAGSEWLLEHGVESWAGPESLPLWLPMPEDVGHMARSNELAKQAGLGLRPLARTVQSALTWERQVGLNRSPRKAGLSRERERELIRTLLGEVAGPHAGQPTSR